LTKWKICIRLQYNQCERSLRRKTKTEKKGRRRKEDEEKKTSAWYLPVSQQRKLQFFLASFFSRGQLTPRRLFDPFSNKAHLELFREIASSSFRISRFPLLCLPTIFFLLFSTLKVSLQHTNLILSSIKANYIFLVHLSILIISRIFIHIFRLSSLDVIYWKIESS